MSNQKATAVTKLTEKNQIETSANKPKPPISVTKKDIDDIKMRLVRLEKKIGIR